MAETKLFIVTKRGRAERFSDRVLQLVAPQYRSLIVRLEEEDFGVGDPSRPTNDATQAAKNISDHIDDADAASNSHLLIDREIRASQEKLINRWDEAGRDTSLVYKNDQQRLVQKLDKLLIDQGIHWQPYAQRQIARFAGQTTPLQDWCDQFAHLGVAYMGRRLLMQLQVISFADNGKPFAPRRHDVIGQKAIHCYFNDGDPGGSWVSVQDQLSHDIPEQYVQPIEVKLDAFALPVGEVDELLIYEDGLWSGSETVKRLTALKGLADKRPITLKFAVVTDFGLMVARHAIRHLGLQGSVRVDASDAKLEYFIKATLPVELELGHGMQPEAYFSALHEHVERAAFRNSHDWPEGRDKAMEIAKSLGGQLVRRWYETERPEEDAEKGVEKFDLGGGGFASTTVFARSVPKVCLPLFWLSGPVSLNDRTIDWKPLFLDARRVNPKLLLTA